MRIAQVAPLVEAVPPKLYGGTERVVSWLTEELVAQGHDVTLFASGDSRTSATLVPAIPKGLRLSGIYDHTANTLIMLEHIRKRADDFDIIHFHVDLLQFPLFQDLFQKCVTTLHGRLDMPDLCSIFQLFPGMPLVSISNNQRSPMPPALNWVSTIHHGLPSNFCSFSPRDAGYLAFLGRIAEEKRPDRAIEIAKRSGVPLKIAAKIEPTDRGYFTDIIKPLLDHPLVEFVGEIGDHEKSEFLGGALALLFPIEWPEPFGLVMIEAMATGTPVIAWRRGSVPEIVDQGITGVAVDSIDDALQAIKHVRSMSRFSVRQRFEMRFTASRMAQKYLAVYQRILGQPAKRAFERKIAGAEIIENVSGSASPLLGSSMKTNGIATAKQDRT